MKGVILAGGLGTRLYPLTYVTNKHLLPVYDQPMIFYPIQTLVKAGIKEILIIVGGPHAGDLMQVLRLGKEYGVGHLEYVYQEKADGGISDAISLAEDFADGDSISVILGDNTTDRDITEEVGKFKDGALVFVKKVSDPKRFGVPVFGRPKKGNRPKIIRIEEKPEKPKSEFAVTGLYLYDNTVFSKIKKLKPSERGQLEVTDLNNLYIEENKLDWQELKGFWSDAGTPSSLFKASAYWAIKKGDSF